MYVVSSPDATDRSKAPVRISGTMKLAATTSVAIAEKNGNSSSSLSWRRTAPLALINSQLRENRVNMVFLPACCWALS